MLLVHSCRDALPQAMQMKDEAEKAGRLPK
jgi:hypothetical protein